MSSGIVYTAKEREIEILFYKDSILNPVKICLKNKSLLSYWHIREKEKEKETDKTETSDSCASCTPSQFDQGYLK